MQHSIPPESQPSPSGAAPKLYYQPKIFRAHSIREFSRIFSLAIQMKMIQFPRRNKKQPNCWYPGVFLYFWTDDFLHEIIGIGSRVLHRSITSRSSAGMHRVRKPQCRSTGDSSRFFHAINNPNTFFLFSSFEFSEKQFIAEASKVTIP